MTAMATTDTPAHGLPRGRALTHADLATMPDDGHRYELLDGTLIVSPAPTPRHQRAVFRLGIILEQARSDDLEVLPAPLDVTLADDTVLQPDLIIAPREHFTEHNLPGPPLLAIEVLSPSTRGLDLLLKKDRLERAGCTHYWVIDPDQPTITAWTLHQDEDHYVQTTHATGQDPFTVTEPFPVTLTLTDLTH